MRPPLKVGVCENSAADLQAIRICIGQSGYAAQTECFESGEKLLESFKKGRYHVVFMDIYMNGMTGIEAARAMREADPDVLIVFVTVSQDFALESYRLGALKYIEKPVTLQSVKDSLSLAWTLREKQDVLSVYVNKERALIPANEVFYIEAADHACLIHTESGVIKTYAKFSEVCDHLPPNFLKCHRAYAVNMDHVRSIEQDFIMENDEVVYISRKDITQTKKNYANYLCSIARESHAT